MIAPRLLAPGMAVVAMLSFAVFPATAQVYRWTAADGSVHYGDHPPDAVVARPVDIDAGSGGEPTGLRSGERQRLEEISARRQRAASAGDAVSASDNDLDRRDCERATRTHEQARRQLRAGYRPSEGDDLRRQVRTARAAMQRYCP